MYDGEWKDRLRHGHGTMDWKEEGERYTGDWVDGIQVNYCPPCCVYCLCSMAKVLTFGSLDILITHK